VWSNLRAKRFAAYGPKADLAKYGLKKPALILTVTLKPAGEKAKPVEHTLALGKSVPGAVDKRYALLDQGPGVAVLDETTTRRLGYTYLRFVDHTVWKLDAKAVTGFLRKTGEETLEIVKKGDKWQLLKPGMSPADDSLESLLGQLADLRAREVAAYPAKDLKAFGLDRPETVLTVRLANARKKPVERVLKIGKLAEGAAEAGSGARYAMVGKGKTVFLLSGPLVKDLLAKALNFCDHMLPHPAAVDRFILERGPRKAVFAKVDDAWKMTEPLEAEVEQADLDTFLKAPAKLRADELVAEKPADLKPYGLDRPAARWRFFKGDKEVLGLLVGDREKPDSSRRYAKLAGGNLVFLLDAALTGKFLGEYRSRAVWTGVDAAQIEQIRYGSSQQPFALTKVDNDWQVAGKPAAKVKAEAVSDALDALAGLKAARYVVDKTTDLKPYGLKEPPLVLELKPRSGPAKVLHIGRPVGGSKRYYARVVDGDNSAVFIIAEADAKRIVRSLKEFTEASK
jgi:hypothetical protein